MVAITENSVRDRIVSRLKELGLSTHEALAYIVLLTHPNVTASTLCRETDIPDSKIYYALDGLSKKGMLLIQQGTPSIYRPLSPKEALANVKQQLTDRLNEKIKEADILVDLLTPLYEGAEKQEEAELAYIIRGQKNIINRMRNLIEAARSEITIFISYPAMLEEIKDVLVKAREKRRVKLNIAVTPEVYERKDELAGLGEVRLLCCVLGLLISDMKTLLTMSSWTNEIAMLTQDQNLMRVCRDYYDNPVCCKEA